MREITWLLINGYKEAWMYMIYKCGRRKHGLFEAEIHGILG